MSESIPQTEGKRNIMLRVSPAQHDRLVQDAARLTIEEGRKVSVPEVIRRRALLDNQQVAA